MASAVGRRRIGPSRRTGPAALAHNPAGTPRNYCEDPSEWGTHDYAPSSTGVLIANSQDGNLGGDSDGDTVPADYDGHIEWAQGGGWLSADSGDGVTTGSIYCFGEEAHHPAFGPFTVNDVLFGNAVQFSVAADTVSLVPPTSTDNCGDFESDQSTTCVGSCIVTFPAGLDGTYQVYVCGSAGHIDNSGGGPSLPIVDCEATFTPGLTLAGCTITFALETADNVLDYPGDVVNNGPFAATDEMIVDQTADTTEFLGCVL